ncbi:MAG: response regulator [Thermoflavifilum sp.]|nr:response regulator [Thermoflavifilum sp.]
MAQYLVKKVFLIDDDPIHLQVGSLLLQKSGLIEEIKSFQEAQAALDYLQAHTSDPEQLPDVILLDLNMPEMDGWAFLDSFERIRDNGFMNVRIFIYTSSINYHDRQRAHQYASVNGYLVKPLSREDIQLIVNSVHP